MMQMKSLKVVAISSIWAMLFACSAIETSAQKTGVPSTAHANSQQGTLQIRLPSDFLNESTDLQRMNRMVASVGKVYDTLVDLKRLALTVKNGEVLTGRIKIVVEGAIGVILYFKEFRLPEEATLTFKSGNTEGPEKSIDRRMLTGGAFSLPMVEGESIELRWNLPVEAEKDLAMMLAGFGIVLYPENTLIGGSGACEVNVNCPEGDAWKDQRDAVVRILVRNQQSVYWCTGVLVNNTARDKTPYILTANHCGKGATPENVAQWQFFFNYEAEGCPNPIYEPEKKMAIGGRKRAASDTPDGKLGSDFYLLTLLNGIPAGARAYFAGWSRKDEPPSGGVCIHHPQGDLKKISTFTTSAVSSSWESTPGTHWKVVWAATANGHGVTEGGSSGSPLFNPEGFLVGTLTGGQASCDSASLNQPDYFGKFSYHWSSNGTADTLQLRPYLDPLNTGTITLEGTPLAIDERPSKAFSLQVVPNPAFKSFYLKSLIPGVVTEPIRLSLFDFYGKLMFVREMNSPDEAVDIAALPRGIYLVRVETLQQVFFLKVMKM